MGHCQEQSWIHLLSSGEALHIWGCWCEAQLLGSTAVTLSDEQQLKAYYFFLVNIMRGDLYEIIL